MMTEEEIRQLIPLYVAKTLGPEEQKAVEEGLRQWPELQKDLEFWTNTSSAVLAQATFEAEAHPSAEDLVAYTEWTLKEPARRLEIERHMRECTTCSEAYSLLRDTEEIRPIPGPSLLDRVKELAKSLKFVYVVPTLALAALVAVILVPRLLWPPETAHLILTYEPETREVSTLPLQVLQLNATTEDVKFMFAFPHNAATTATYDVGLQQDQSSIETLFTAMKPLHQGLPNDSLTVTVPAKRLAGSAREYRIVITENPGSIQGPPLPAMIFPFTIERGR
jgi:hypothetical protein